MNFKEILSLCLALVLVFGILALPYDFDLSINNKNNSNKVEEKPDDHPSDTDGDGTDNNGNDNSGGNTPENGGNTNLIETAMHPVVRCSECLAGEDSLSVFIELYGSIGEQYYSIYCFACDVSSDSVSITHEYSNNNGVCTARGCGHECTHTFTQDAINFVLPYDERFSMFDSSTLSDGDSAVYNGVCTICNKTIN